MKQQNLRADSPARLLPPVHTLRNETHNEHRYHDVGSELSRCLLLLLLLLLRLLLLLGDCTVSIETPP